MIDRRTAKSTLIASVLIALLWCCVTPLQAWPPDGTPMRVSVSRDTWVSSYGDEKVCNLGGSGKLKTKSFQEFTLLDIDTENLRGRVIKGAMLHLCRSSGQAQRRLTVSSLASPWVEGTSNRYVHQRNSASFDMARQDVVPWAYAGSDITAVINGLGHTVWHFADATPPDHRGWQQVAVAPEVVAARVAGLSHGLVVFDDVGSEYTREGDRFVYHPFPNRFVFSRESGMARAPYLTVWIGAVDRTAPSEVSMLAVDANGLPEGEAFVSWRTPPDSGPAGTLGYLARWSRKERLTWEHGNPVPRYLIPMAGKPGERVVMHLRDIDFPIGEPINLGVRAVDAAGNLGPVSQVQLTLARRKQFEISDAGIGTYKAGPSTVLPEIDGMQVSVIDALDKLHPATGKMIPPPPENYLKANHIWSAQQKTVRLFAARNEHVLFQLVVSGEAASLELAGKLLDRGGPTPSLRWYTFHHVNTSSGPLPDPLVRTGDRIELPPPSRSAEQPRYVSVVGEIYIPHDAKPGPYRGKIQLRNGGETLTLNLRLRVWDFMLPDHLSFVPQMNSYGLPGPPKELAYYRLAHEHRTCLNRLSYNWQGRIHEGFVPKASAGRAWDWRQYDRRFGPLFDGSAFADLPRGAIPVEAFYLPFNENWPAPLARHFRGGYWIESAIDPAYWKHFREDVARFVGHLRDKQWNQTFFEFYLNNKVYHKRDHWSKSSAPWIFDEPAHTQDFWALRRYAIAFHRAITPVRGDLKIGFRADISRPQWQRNLLDGLLDVNVVGGSFFKYHRMVLERKRDHNEIVYVYGAANAVDEPNIQPVAWCLSVWQHGGNGVLPWQTIGKAKSWRQGDALSLFYPGSEVEQDEPLPSIRLKAFRRGQQDVEYLTILTRSTGLPRWAVARSLRQVVNLSASSENRGEEASELRFDQLNSQQLWRLRTAIGMKLDQLKPRDRRKYVELRTPLREVDGLAALGYVRPAPDIPEGGIQPEPRH